MIKHFLILISLFAHLMTFGQYTEDEWKKRDKWMDIEGILEAMSANEGDIVADLGSHEGYMTLHLSKAVGQSGKVYAVDVEKYKLRNLEKNMKRRDVTNVETVLGDYDNPKLTANSLDAIVIMDAYHEMDDYMEILEHVKNALKPGGRLVMIEEIDNFRKDQTRKQQTGSHDLGIKYARKELSEAGFMIQSEIPDFGLWENKKDKRIWLLVATRPQL